MQEEILEFIRRRWKTDANWLNGNCYWFAKILCERFPPLSIYYLPIAGHFVAGAFNNYYDWTGVVHPKEKPYLFVKIKDDDPLWYSHIVRDCVM